MDGELSKEYLDSITEDIPEKEAELKIYSQIVYRRTTYAGDHSIEEIFEGSVEDVIQLFKAIFEIEKEDGDSLADY